ncbi:hypothetical protein RchiOBHm_Chr5g0026791 [Rosa chinensis]|uniref:Uncharacterized protein n=1 Tax=Rosa chinensis TaxID=74649 RepID=A0A2P6Q900_ROSCH|nr:hypothetical protein RchiOBHm_Chr5g0026791 [Rosa chinensis]
MMLSCISKSQRNSNQWNIRCLQFRSMHFIFLILIKRYEKVALEY